MMEIKYSDEISNDWPWLVSGEREKCLLFLEKLGATYYAKTTNGNYIGKRD